MVFVDYFQCLVNDSECMQIEEVEFYQFGVFYVVFIKLGNWMQFLFIVIQWCEIGDFGWSDNYFIGMFIGVLCYFFQFMCYVDQCFYFFVCFVDFWQLWFGFKGFCQCYVWIGWYQFGDMIDKFVWVIQYVIDIVDDCFCCYGIEGDDL